MARAFKLTTNTPVLDTSQAELAILTEPALLLVGGTLTVPSVDRVTDVGVTVSVVEAEVGVNDLQGGRKISGLRAVASAGGSSSDGTRKCKSSHERGGDHGVKVWTRVESKVDVFA